MKIGLQLFSVRDELVKDYMGTLEKVAAMGFEYVEFANHNAGKEFEAELPDPVELKKHLDRLGLKVICSHLCDSDIDGFIDYNLKIGSSGIVMPMAFFNSKEQTVAYAKELNAIGKKCADAGLNFYYHNHFQEFEKFEGETVMEILINNTSPAYVNFELDTYWTQRGGVNPVEYLQEIGERCKIVHQKDINKSLAPEDVNILDHVEGEITMDTVLPVMKPENFTEIGTGTMDIKAIVDQVNQMDSVEYIIVEVDMSTLPSLESVEISLKNLKKIMA